MADAARVAFGAELGATLQRLKAMVEPGSGPSGWKWEPWLTHAAAAAAAAALTWAAAVTLWAH